MTNATEHPFVGQLLAAGAITQDEADCLVDEVENVLSKDPYGTTSFVSVWEQRNTDKVYLINAYHRTRRYGGPEEGGWWYDQHDALTDEFAQYWNRSFVVAGPFRDANEAWDVAHDLNACEGIGFKYESDVPVVWRVQAHVAFNSPRPVYC